MIKPIDSNNLRENESFFAQTEKTIQYEPKKGERYETVRPGTSEIWKVISKIFKKNKKTVHSNA